NPRFWRPIASQAGVPAEADGGKNLFDWLAGCLMIYLALFGTGKIIFGQTFLGSGLLALAAFAGVWLYRDLRQRQWKTVADSESGVQPPEWRDRSVFRWPVPACRRRHSGQ